MYAIGAKINGVLCGGCTVEQIRKARAVELNASWCYDWGQKLGDLMEERFGIPYARTDQPYDLKATEEWVMGVAVPLGLERQARQDCEGIIPQFHRCEQCRADVVYLP